MLVEAGNIEDIQPVVERADDEGADEGAGDAAFAAGEAGAAENDSGDGVQFIAGACRRLRGVQAGGEDRAGESTEQTGDGIGYDLDAVDLDACDIGDLFIAAHRVGLTSERRLVQDEEQNEEGNEHEDRRNGNARHVALTEAGEDGIFGEAADRVAVRIDQRGAAVHGHGGKRRNEGRHLAVGNDDAVHSAEAEADEGRHDDCHFRIHAGGDHAGQESAGEREDAPDGQVNAAREDDEGHAEGNERIDGDLTKQVAQVRRRNEAVVQHGNDRKQNDKSDERPHFSQQIFSFCRIH